MGTARPLYKSFLSILQEELVPALGCTEPIAIAYAAAVAAHRAGGPPRSILAECSGNIIKNVKSVTVPNSGGMRGIAAAALLGALGGDPDRQLEVLQTVCPQQIAQARAMEAAGVCRVSLARDQPGLYLCLTLTSDFHTVSVTICGTHTNITRLTQDGRTVYQSDDTGQECVDRSALSLASILDFAQSARIEDLRSILLPQIQYNTAIAEEGLRGAYGAQVGRTLMTYAHAGDLFVRLRAAAAAGSDARMSGCTLPVVINSGSGNQGITVSVPVILYGRSQGVPEDMIYRALALANLTAIYQKTGIGRLSAYCGAVSAGAGAGAGIAYLCGGGYDEVVHTVVNALAVVSGIVCDGAKASCAAKIASAVDAGILGYNMYIRGQQFYGGDGIVTKGVEATIANVGRLGKDGMKATNEEIIRIMVGDKSLC